MLFIANLMASTDKTKSNTTQAIVHRKHKDIITQNKHKKIKNRFGHLL